MSWDYDDCVKYFFTHTLKDERFEDVLWRDLTGEQRAIVEAAYDHEQALGRSHDDLYRTWR